MRKYTAGLGIFTGKVRKLKVNSPTKAVG